MERLWVVAPNEATIGMEFWEHERLNRPDLAKRSTLSGNLPCGRHY